MAAFHAELLQPGDSQGSRRGNAASAKKNKNLHKRCTRGTRRARAVDVAVVGLTGNGCTPWGLSACALSIGLTVSILQIVRGQVTPRTSKLPRIPTRDGLLNSVREDQH